MWAVLEEHRGYLSDDSRLSAFRSALGAILHGGETVVDLGSGTGILGMIACSEGAGEVWSIERSGMADVIEELARANGIADRLRVYRGMSTEFDCVRDADVVIADQMGPFGYEAGIARYFCDARRRFLKPGGITVPARIDLELAPVGSADLEDLVGFWRRRPAGMDMTPLAEMAASSYFAVNLAAGDLLGEPTAGGKIDPGSDVAVVRVAGDLLISQTGRLAGIGGWFTAWLAPNVSMTSSPLAGDRIKRANAFFPLTEPAAVAPGDRVVVTMRLDTHEYLASWKVELIPAGSDQRQVLGRMSTLRSLLFDREDLRRSSPEYVPRLTAAGQAWVAVLQLSDGARSRAEIEAELSARFPAMFASSAEVGAFVSRIVDRSKGLVEDR